MQLNDSCKNRRRSNWPDWLTSGESKTDYLYSFTSVVRIRTATRKSLLRETLINHTSVYVGEFPKIRGNIRLVKRSTWLIEREEWNFLVYYFIRSTIITSASLKPRLHPDATTSALKPWPRYRANSADVFHSSSERIFFFPKIDRWRFPF